MLSDKAGLANSNRGGRGFGFNLELESKGILCEGNAEGGMFVLDQAESCSATC